MMHGISDHRNVIFSYRIAFLQGHVSWAITIDCKVGAHIICCRLTCILSPKHTPVVTEDGYKCG